MEELEKKKEKVYLQVVKELLKNKEIFKKPQKEQLEEVKVMIKKNTHV